MPIRTDLNTEALLAQFRAHKSASARSASRAGSAKKTDVRLQAQVSASGLMRTGSDSVEISLAANMTAEAANGIVMDSVVEQINKAIQEAGIDLTIEEAKVSGMDLSPEATARRIVDFAGGFLDDYQTTHSYDPARVRIAGFMSLMRGAIEDGFHQARDFLDGVTKLSDTIDQNISRTFELANQYLDAFHESQLQRIEAAADEPEAGASSAADSSPEVVE